MMPIRRTCHVLILLAVTASLLAADANQYSFRAALAFDRVIDIAAADDRIFALSPGTLSILDPSAPGPLLRRVAAISISRELLEVPTAGDIVALASRTGKIDIYQSNGTTLAQRATLDLPDSIMAMTMVGTKLCLAQGFAGVTIIDVADPSHPRTRQTLMEPDYSEDVDCSGEFLFVLDVLNGVTVYSWRGEAYRHFDDILTDVRPVDISATGVGVAICYETERLESWRCSDSDGAVLDWATELGFRSTRVTAEHIPNGKLYVGSASGDLAVISGNSGAIVVQSSLSYPIEDLLIFGNTGQYSLVALDRSGSVTAFRNELLLGTRASFAGAASPTAIVAVKDALMVSTAAGIQSFSVEGSDVIARTLLPGVPISTVLAESESYVFAGSSANGLVWTFVRERGRWGFLGEITSGLTLRNLFVRRGGQGEINVVAVGDKGIKCFGSDDGINFEPICSLSVTSPITCADLAGNFLATALENGDLALYSLDQSEIALIGATRSAQRPRDVEVMADGFIIAAHADGIQIFEFLPAGGGVVEHPAPPAISAAFDLHYDEATHELLVAEGQTPLKYLDVSNPAQAGTVFLIPGTEGTSRIAYRDGLLYCLSADWIRTFDRIETGRLLPVADATLQSVSAAPNPFNSDTQITIELHPSTGMPLPLELSLVNILGQTIAHREYLAFESVVILSLPRLVGNGPALPSGIYFCVVRAHGEAITHKLVLLK